MNAAKMMPYVGTDGVVKGISIPCAEGSHRKCKRHFQAFRWDCVCGCHTKRKESEREAK